MSRRFVASVVEHCLPANLDVAQRAFIALYKDETAWLWAQGDDEKLDGVASALKLDIPSIPMPDLHSPLRQRLSTTSFSVRLRTITWLIITSSPIQHARRSMGLTDWREWCLQDAIRHFDRIFRGFPPLVALDLDVPTFREAFLADLHTQGHAHDASVFGKDDDWMLVQAFLSPKGLDMGLIHIAQGNGCSLCAYLGRVYHCNDSGDLPPPYLILIRAIWLRYAPETESWTNFTQYLSSKDVPSCILPMGMYYDEYDLKYQPWVNLYPVSLRAAVTSLTASQWRSIVIPLTPEEHKTGIRGWITLVYTHLQDFLKIELSNSEEFSSWMDEFQFGFQENGKE